VAPSTRALVEEVAQELRYRADPSASRLARGRTSTVAMAVPVIDGWYFSRVIAGAEAVLADAGYDLLVFAVDGDAARRRVLAGPLVKRADGLIVVDLHVPADDYEQLARSGVRVVSIGVETDQAHCVHVDDRRIGAMATRHLLDLGHERIGLIGGLVDDPMRFPVPVLRRLGYRSALDEHGVPNRPEYEVSGNFSMAGGTEAMTQLLALSEPPTAVFAMSDEMAFGALGAIWHAGRRVPADLSIVAVDDHEFATVVGLTTVHQRVADHGAIAARLVLENLRVDGVPVVRHEIDVELILRTSTAPSPG
jgi:DNA-binding LacI/PurR family transcriptional regulator